MMTYAKQAGLILLVMIIARNVKPLRDLTGQAAPSA
jgi:hypothetical protein